MMSYYPTFAELLDQYLTAQDRSGAWLAQRLGVNPATVTRWRSGNARPKRPEIIIQLADLLGIQSKERQQLLYTAGYGVIEANATGEERFPLTPMQNQMVTLVGHHSRWLTYPATYRAVEMGTISHWIEMGASGIVLGLAGSGVSSLLRYFVHRLDLLSSYFAEPEQILPVWIELQLGDKVITAEIYRAFLHGIQEMIKRTPHHPLAEWAQHHQVALQTVDLLVLQTNLFTILDYCQSSKLRLIFVWDRIELLDPAVRFAVGVCLRAIRDGFPDTVIYLMGLRYTPTYLEDLYAFEGLGRLVSSHICVVGGLTDEDSQFVIAMRSNTTAVQPTKTEVTYFLELSGGYPTLLKAVTRWWLTQAQVRPPAEWLAILLQEPGIQLRLREIWHCLNQQEQAAMQLLISNQAPVTISAGIGEQLVKLGLCRHHRQGWQLAGKLLTGVGANTVVLQNV